MHHIILLLTATPEPSPSLRPGISQEDITPGTLGFIMTAFFVVATTLLLVDMVRRVRRVRYRGQLEEQRLAAAAEADAAAEEAADAGDTQTEAPDVDVPGTRGDDTEPPGPGAGPR
ncbi:hypothetical protein V1638_16165 [Pseudarthrobacter sp. J64]|uniref:hypothetical protein n=1 Tax=Pseudarthrobacter sp. J64 TaxID=3116485 RepID=UPI002E81F7DA|nr:hypothetical protein [Pseudarthrobacter sp. J64]MEE2570917.1 hypothetical protein [Pseudarthrobacter sp. J64]